MTTYPLATLACTVGPTGITSPSYNDILQSLLASAASIYGSDQYLGDDSQDYEFMAIYAQAQYDSNQATIATYNQFSPATANAASHHSATLWLSPVASTKSDGSSRPAIICRPCM